MDVPPAAGPEPPSELPAAEPTLADLARRIEAIEAGLGRLSSHLEAMAASLEASFERAVATEVQAVASELRHTVSQLGRILVRDLGTLPQILAKHREAIIAELRAGEGPTRGRSAATNGEPGGKSSETAAVLSDPAGPGPERSDGEGDGTTGGDLAGDPAGSTGAGITTDEAIVGESTDRNWRDHLRRNRQS